MTSDKSSALDRLKVYIRNLRGTSPYWRSQAVAWGIILVLLIGGGGLFFLMALSSVYGGGTITYEAIGSPGPVVFRHYNHMWFENGKYKDCKTCHDQPFAAQKYGTFVLRAFRDSPPRKLRIGKNLSTLFVPDSAAVSESTLITYKVPRACRSCATGNCHDGKESFGRFDCLGCHQRR
ncbi:MAG: hypothetical protein P8182_18575 [Deltaproteobacteria bacterium]